MNHHHHHHHRYNHHREGNFVNTPIPHPQPHPEGNFVNSPFHPHLHREGNFVNSPIHHHHHHPPFPPPPPHDIVYDDRNRFNYREPLPPPPPIRVSPLPPLVHRQVDFHDFLSPPPPPQSSQFVNRFTNDFRSPRFSAEFDVDSRRRDFNLGVDRGELRSFPVYDDDMRRSMDVVERDGFGRSFVNDDWRSRDVVERDGLRRDMAYDDWRFMNDFEREELVHRRMDERMRIRDDLERKELLRQRDMVERDEFLCDRVDYERRIMSNGFYHDLDRPEVLFKDSEWGLGSRDYGRGEVFDHRGPTRDENVPGYSGRHGGFDARYDVSRSPIRFQGIDIAAEKRFPVLYEERINHRMYDDGGRRERERSREDLQECDDHTARTNSSRKKSAFLRLQPAIQDNSDYRNRLGNTTSSPHKGKKTCVESLGQSWSKDKFLSPLNLDVSFKSNTLVAKVISGTPSSSEMDGNKNLGVSDLDTMIVSESQSPLKARRSRNRGNNSPMPKKEDKELRVSPILMKVGIRKVAEAPDNSSKSSSSGCSSLSGGDNTYCKASHEGEVLSKDEKRDGICKVSSPSIRRKRKAVNLISCLSASVATNLDSGVDVDNSISSPSGGSMSDAPGSLEPGCMQDEPQLSNLDDDVIKSIDKCSSDIDTKKGVGQHQGSALALIGHGNADGSSEPLVVSVGDNIGKVDICCGHPESNDSRAAMNSITCVADAAIMTENRPYLANSNVNVYEPRGLSPECDIQFSNGQIDGDDNEAELRHSGDEIKLAYSQSNVSNDDIPSTDCVTSTTISDMEVTHDIQEQHCTGAGTILVNDETRKRRKISSKAFVSMGGSLGHLALPSVKEDIFSLDRIQVSAVDPKDYPCNCGKERKTILLDSVFVGTSVSESCDFCASANALKSIANGPLYSVDYSEQAAGGLEISNSLVPSALEVGEATNNLLTNISVLGNCSKVEVQQIDLHSPVEQIAASGCNRKDDDDLMDVGDCLGDEPIRPVSKVELADKYTNSGVHCKRQSATGMNHAVGLNDGSNRSNLTAKGNMASPEIVTSKAVMLNKQSKVNSLVGFSPVTSVFGISSPAIHATSDIIGGAGEKSESSKSLGALNSQSNLLHGGFQKDVNPGKSAASSNWPFTKKAASLPLKRASEAMPIPSSASRRFSWRNELSHGKTTLSSSQTPVTVFSKTIGAKPRTWHRTDNPVASNPIVKKPSSSTATPQRPPYGKFLKVQDTSYIRKGNSLVRNQPVSTTALGPSAINTSSNQAKLIDINKNAKLKGSGTANSIKSPDRLITGGQHSPIEMANIPPSPCSENTSDCNIAYVGNCTSPLQVERFQGMDNKVALNATQTTLCLSGNPESVLDRSLEDADNFSDGVLQALNVKKVVYIKRKANQLIATSTPPELSDRDVDKKLGLSSDNSYYKRRKNQLIRASSESNIQKMVSAADDNSNSQTQKPFSVYSYRSASKGLSSTSRPVKSLKVSLVWKLGDAKSSDKGSEPVRTKQLLSHLLPWKRTTYRRSVWRASASSSSSSSLIKPRKLLTSRNQAVLYVRSGRGFSLKRSKVISLAGSLKWSKSMEKRSKKVDEEAALALGLLDSTARHKTGASGASSEADCGKLSSHKSVHGLKLHPGERIFRVGLFKYRMDPSRRTLQRITDEEAPDSTTSKTEKSARKSYMPKRLLIGSDEYVRIGNGNQLVRDPKRRTRILASEKVRWSLHTARLRLAKKRKFCQFFTRFGRCNKSEGKCPYIHDASKITICTKFLKGLCTDPKCKLTHKVIPDRMPDCSFFLQGLCSNESCPYRHVNVDSNASICENFLRGYCAEGNECQKKHSYLCPEYEATGSCPQGSKCKLYHPKKGSSKKGKLSEDQRNIRGRYFDPGLTATVSKRETETAILEKDVTLSNNVVLEGGDLGDFISLDVSDDEAGETIYPSSEATYLPEFVQPTNSCVLSREDLGGDYMNKEVMYLSEFDVLISVSDSVDELAKPLCILDTQ
ncbi:uncharacterized protein LOC141605370 [Silene latifolia]|uniref:uncharacterized protein LOC141605370 n=1 Tax=Silene latifolia TaxID=37657 RepID=UPI003D77D2A4